MHYVHKYGWLLDERARQFIQRAYGIECEPLPRYLRSLMPRFEDPDLGVSGKERRSLAEAKEQIKSREKKYAGAFVLDPTVGMYRQPVSTFDFESLYPSIIIAYQLCFSSWIEHRYDEQGRIWFPLYDGETSPYAAGRKLAEDRYYIWHSQDNDYPDPKVVGDRDLILVAHDPITNVTGCFVQNRQTILPEILKGLLAMRKGVKNELKAAKSAGDAFMASVLDARQAAIKVICNGKTSPGVRSLMTVCWLVVIAAYGFCGAMAGYFGCLPIAICTCMLGRTKIMFTKDIVEDPKTFGGRVIYGDTDSVFVIWPKLEALARKEGWSQERLVDEVTKASHAACERVTKLLPNPMKLAYEKRFSTLLMIAKKQYCGQIMWPEEKLMTKGTINVRRDACEIARECIAATLEAAVTRPGDRKALLDPLDKACAELSDPDVPLERLARTVAVKGAYKNDRIIQKRLFDKLTARRGTPLDIGSRVPYVITLPDGGRRIRRKEDKLLNDGEEIAYMRANNIRADRQWYLDKQILGPLLRYIAMLVPADEIKRRVARATDNIYVQNTRNSTLDTFLLPPS